MSDTLTLDMIEELMSTSKAGKGTYKRDIQNAVDSGNLYTVFSDLPAYNGKDAQATRNSINGNIEKFATELSWPEMTVLFDRQDSKDKKAWKVILVNLDVFAAQKAAQNDDEQV